MYSLKLIHFIWEILTLKSTIGHLPWPKHVGSESKFWTLFYAKPCFTFQMKRRKLLYCNLIGWIKLCYKITLLKDIAEYRLKLQIGSLFHKNFADNHILSVYYWSMSSDIFSTLVDLYFCLIFIALYLESIKHTECNCYRSPVLLHWDTV